MTEDQNPDATAAGVRQRTQALLDELFPYGFEFHTQGLTDQFGEPDTMYCPMAVALGAVEQDGKLLPVLLWGAGEKLWRGPVVLTEVEQGTEEGKLWGAGMPGRHVLKVEPTNGVAEFIFLNAASRYRTPTAEQADDVKREQDNVRAQFADQVVA